MAKKITLLQLIHMGAACNGNALNHSLTKTPQASEQVKATLLHNIDVA